MNTDREQEIIEVMIRLVQESSALILRHHEILEEYERLRQELLLTRARKGQTIARSR